VQYVEVYGVTSTQYFVCQMIYEGLFIIGQKHYVIYLLANDDFITYSPLQLLEVTNPTKGHYE